MGRNAAHHFRIAFASASVSISFASLLHCFHVAFALHSYRFYGAFVFASRLHRFASHCFCLRIGFAYAHCFLLRVYCISFYLHYIAMRCLTYCIELRRIASVCILRDAFSVYLFFEPFTSTHNTHKAIEDPTVGRVIFATESCLPIQVRDVCEAM
jgi:hypothetical protein